MLAEGPSFPKLNAVNYFFFSPIRKFDENIPITDGVVFPFK